MALCVRAARSSKEILAEDKHFYNINVHAERMALYINSYTRLKYMLMTWRVTALLALQLLD